MVSRLMWLVKLGFLTICYPQQTSNGEEYAGLSLSCGFNSGLKN